jgi:branched-chain amino acid transport system substrate-binding protein
MSSEIPLKLHFGVLAPGSNFVPFLAGDLLDAFELGLAKICLDAELVVESAGYNADLRMVIPAVQKLILEGRVHCIVAPLNVSLIEKLAGYCENQAVPLIALNLTEDPLNEAAQNPFVFINSFHLWQCAWMSGYLAAQRFGQRAVAMNALHESGYGLMFAFQLGLEAAQGTLVQAIVTHQNSSTEDPSEFIARAAAQKPDFIWAAYSGKEAASFLTSYEASGLKNHIPVITISPMVARHICKAAGDAVLGIWYAAAEDVEADASVALAEAIGREPNPYAVLAYESVGLIAAAIRDIKDTTDFAADFPGALRRAEFKSQRGTVRFDDGCGVDMSFNLRQITADGDNIVEKIVAPPLLKEQYLLACKKIAKEGWVNPYLCA